MGERTPSSEKYVIMQAVRDVFIHSLANWERRGRAVVVMNASEEELNHMAAVNRSEGGQPHRPLPPAPCTLHATC